LTTKISAVRVPLHGVDTPNTKLQFSPTPNGPGDCDGTAKVVLLKRRRRHGGVHTVHLCLTHLLRALDLGKCANPTTRVAADLARRAPIWTTYLVKGQTESHCTASARRRANPTDGITAHLSRDTGHRAAFLFGWFAGYLGAETAWLSADTTARVAAALSARADNWTALGLRDTGWFAVDDFAHVGEGAWKGAGYLA
jgi:hypothetical protein